MTVVEVGVLVLVLVLSTTLHIETETDLQDTAGLSVRRSDKVCI